MSETIVVTEGDEPNEAGETVLGEAAVAAAALSGAAAATAQQASGDAEAAERRAEVSNDIANTAVTIAASKPEMEDVEALIDATGCSVRAGQGAGEGRDAGQRGQEEENVLC